MTEIRHPDSAFAVEVKGIEEVKKAMGAAYENLARCFAVGLTASGLIPQNAAKRKAPHKYGNLIRSIHVGVADDQWTVRENVTDPQSSQGAPTPIKSGVVGRVAQTLQETGIAHVTIGTNVEYAAAQEFLWERFGPGPHGTNTGPYLRPALDDNHDAIRKEVGDATRVALRVDYAKRKGG